VSHDLERLTREALEAYANEGAEALLPYLREDVVWEEDPEWPDGQVWHGHEGVRASFRERLETTQIRPVVEGIEASGGRVLILFRWDAVGDASGATAVLYPGVIFTFDGELVARVRFFLDRERARSVFDAERA
jgi:ketosteroid isomerase-like protein